MYWVNIKVEHNVYFQGIYQSKHTSDNQSHPCIWVESWLGVMIFVVKYVSLTHTLQSLLDMF